MRRILDVVRMGSYVAVAVVWIGFIAGGWVIRQIVKTVTEGQIWVN